MLSLVIIDDEKLIREGLVGYIDWSSVGVEVVGVFASARSALDALRGQFADIILTDIKMPGLTGVQFLRDLRHEGGSAEVIFLSAYRNFEYAREAVRLGAFDYLLKPIEEDQLYDCIRRCVAKVRTRVPALGPTEAAVGLERYVLGSTADTGAWSAVAAALGVAPDDGAAVWTLQTLPEAPLPDVGAGTAVCGVQGGTACLVVAGMPPDSFRAIHRTVASWLAGAEPDVRPGWSWSPRAVDLPRLRLEALWGHVGWRVAPGPCDGGFAAARSYAGTVVPPPGLLGPVMNRDRDAAIRCVDLLFLSALAGGRALEFEALRYTVCQSVDRVRLSLADYPYFRTGDQFQGAVEDLNRSPDIVALHSRVREVVGRLVQSVEELFVTDVNRLTNLAIHHIKTHLSEDLSLEAVAASLQISPSYLSRMFVRETGVSFSQYRLNKRLDHAKTLLKDPQIRIKEIAAAVGVDNVTHFTKVFRSATGQSPSEYRKTVTP